MRRLLLLALSSLLLSACVYLAPPSEEITPPPDDIFPTPITEETMTNFDLTNLPSRAIIKTIHGDIEVQLYPDKAPNTVANFAGLAQGTIEWKDPRTGEAKKDTPLYNGTIFHRVIPNFMIQGGDPLGTGVGGPGYRFADEFVPGLTFSEPYLLAMANSGPNTNGSQFFITVVPTPWLDGKHTIFGKVTKGQEIVNRIVNASANADNKPLKDITINSIEIIKK